MSKFGKGPTTRRSFLRNAFAAGTSVGLLSVAKRALAKPREAPGEIKLGVQLYSVRDDCAKDLPMVLKEISRMGYAGVEFAGYHGYSAEDLRKMLDDNELVCCGTHTGIDSLLGDQLEGTVAFHKTLGNSYLIVPGLGGEYVGSKANWLHAAETFNAISEKVRPEGMWTGYHNHSAEFQPVEGGDEGELPWDIFFGNTVEDVVMQFDTGNAMHGGQAAPVYLERYPGRARTVHMKEFSSTNAEALLGEGEVPWQEILNLCSTIGATEWYIVEQESYAFPPLECIEKCLDNLVALLEEQHA